MSNATAKRTATRLIKKALVEGAPKGSKKAAALAVYAAAEGERKVGVDRLARSAPSRIRRPSKRETPIETPTPGSLGDCGVKCSL